MPAYVCVCACVCVLGLKALHHSTHSPQSRSYIPTVCTPLWTSMSSTLTHTHATFTHTYESESSQRTSLWRWARPDYVVNRDETHSAEASEEHERYFSLALSLSIWACVFVIGSNWMIITILNENYKLALLICAARCLSHLLPWHSRQQQKPNYCAK